MAQRDACADAVDSSDRSRLLVGAEAKLFRGIAARLNYMSTDRPDVQYAVKEAARAMSSPCMADCRLLTTMGRYLVRRPRIAITFLWQKRQTQLDGYTDSDLAGCSE